VVPFMRMSEYDPNSKHAKKRQAAARHLARHYVPDFTPALKFKFLEWLRKGYTVTKACGQVGVTPRQAYTHRNAYTEFADQWDDALEEGSDLLEDVAVKRAVEGTERPIFQGGIKVGTEHVCNDNLLMFLLKGKKPEKYRERHDLTSGGEGIVQSFARALMELPKYGPSRRSDTKKG